MNNIFCYGEKSTRSNYQLSVLVNGTFEVGKLLVDVLKAREKISNTLLRQTMSDVFDGSDSQGMWLWKDAYDAVEIALVLYLRHHLKEFSVEARPENKILTELEFIENLCPTHSKRSEETLELQQFSTPIPLAYTTGVAARVCKDDVILEPSAGIGILAVNTEMRCRKLILNEISPKRVGILRRAFTDALITTHNAEQINDFLGKEFMPTLVVMNPPFSASPRVQKRMPHATAKHIGSALARLPQGGRLVAIAANWFSPHNRSWKDTFINWQAKAQLVFSVGIAGKLYAKHGTSVDTRLMVFDKVPAPDPAAFNVMKDVVNSTQELLDLVLRLVPARKNIDAEETDIRVAREGVIHLQFNVPDKLTSLSDLPLFQYLTDAIAPQKQMVQKPAPLISAPKNFGKVSQLCYTLRDWQESQKEISECLYEVYETQSVEIAGAAKHPSPLVESAAMSSVALPKPSYRPYLPERLWQEGILSAAQLESIIYAGEAHQGFLSGLYLVDDTLDEIVNATEDEPNAVRFRRGWFQGDATGCGKGRQVAGVILDNYLQGRTKALWISKSNKLIEDARRDWSALGGDKDQIVPLNKFRQGETIELTEGIIFTTYATLRTEERQGKKSRISQLIDWCQEDFEGVVIFDESHAMGNAASSKGSRGMKKASQQGVAGLRLQHGLPHARIVYVSATGATSINNLAYAVRLGLWQTQDFPFLNRHEFMANMEQGGIAAMEVVSRDLKALGLYLSRSLSYEGVEYEIVEHELTPEQILIYNTYADAFEIIHQNIDAALEATNITDYKGKTRNGNASSAARSAFEGNKQRFFNHLLIAMKCPTLLKSIEQDLSNGHAVVIQLVSTNEALLERRLANIPVSEWADINVDITPREYVMDYLTHSFPVHLHEVYADADGNERSKAAVDPDGKAVLCQEALRLRDDLVEHLGLLPPVPGALDQIVQHFGYENVAEVTGRSRRIVRVKQEGQERLCVQNRPGSANLSEAEAFMEGNKNILIFSEAGGTGRSYHADLNVRNQRLRVHYLLEAGWRADNAIQGLGRTNRTNQKQPPLFRPGVIKSGRKELKDLRS